MQYILSEEEMEQMTNVSEVECRNKTLREVRLTLLSYGRFSCIYTQEGRHSKCDDCPCSYGKHTTFTYEQSRLICTEIRKYSK